MYIVLAVGIAVMAFILALSIYVVSKGYAYQDKADEIDERKPEKDHE